MALSVRYVIMLLLTFIFTSFYLLIDRSEDKCHQNGVDARSEHCIDYYDFKTFSDFDNVSGYPDPIVPNIVHFIRMQQPYVPFYEMVNIKAVFLNQQPEWIFIHCDNCSFYGRYWEALQREFGDSIILRQVEPPKDFFGFKFANKWHQGDAMRILVLMEYGGIFLDNDIYVVRSLDRFRHFEMSLGWDEGQFLGTQVLIAHRNARFLKLWHECYRDYHGDRWYFNAGELPTKAVLYQHPEIVHRVKLLFGVHMLVKNLYKTFWDKWEEQYTIHLLMRHRSYLDKNSPIKEFDEQNIRRYNFTYGAMVRKIIFGTTLPVNDSVISGL